MVLCLQQCICEYLSILCCWKTEYILYKKIKDINGGGGAKSGEWKEVGEIGKIHGTGHPAITTI